MSLPAAFRHRDLEFLVEVGETAAAEILLIYHDNFTVEYKDGYEPVTLADRQANRLISRLLAERFPEDGLLTEEEGVQAPSAPASGRVWFVDPIDGTKEFIRKNGEFAIQIGAARDGKMEIGLVLQPTTGDIWLGAIGEGCRHRSSRNEWSDVRIVAPAPETGVIVAMSRSHPSGLAHRTAEALGMAGTFIHGSVGLKLMGIANGQGHFYLNDSNSTKAWDIASPEILFTEAGGIVTDLLGQRFVYSASDPFHHNGLLASCDAKLHQRILDLVAKNSSVPPRMRR
ncbi:MAG: 3'(2'),5'-bisphosphate nucleotidase CysQ [Candidatus Riflebacteria bacterium]|nr:3'(2'),5'-bisphosphate nucleotidase CysQ [Candidatus Riflebacteria bacterium]